MKIAQVQKSSLIEYPGKISAILFMQGCNFLCPYCHNPELVDPSLFTDPLSEEEILAWLKKRRGLLDAVVITGGEPTLQPDLIPFIRRIKALGYLVKLDTNGSCPDVLSEALSQGLTDYVAMDIKAALTRYPEVAMRDIDIRKIETSIRTIMSSTASYEFRTTLVADLLSIDDIIAIGELIKGAPKYILQKFTPSKHVDHTYISSESFTQEETNHLLEGLKSLVGQCTLR